MLTGSNQNAYSYEMNARARNYVSHHNSSLVNCDIIHILAMLVSEGRGTGTAHWGPTTGSWWTN